MELLHIHILGLTVIQGHLPTVLLAGTINLVITDSNSCVLNLTGTVTQPTSALSANLSFTDATCFGDADGSAAVNISGGTPAYSYLWTPGAATTSSITGLAQGTYNVTVTDSRNCTYTGSVTIIQPAQLWPMQDKILPDVKNSMI